MIRRIKLSIIFLLVVAISTLTTAYAWISLATVNRIQNISLNAITQYDLLISLDGENYYEEIPKELILNKLTNLKFNDVTSLDGLTFYNSHEQERIANSDRDYLSIDIYFQTTSRYRELHLSDNHIDADYESPPEEGTYITSKGKNFKSNYRFLYAPDDYVEVGEVRKYFAHWGMRVSFHNYLEETTKIFDLSGNEERGFGERFGAFEYYQLVRAVRLDPPEAPETIYELSTFSTQRPIALTDTSYLVTLVDQGNTNSKGETLYEGKIQMNVWLEGWDADSFDAVQYDQLKMQFMFRAVMPKELLGL